MSRATRAGRMRAVFCPVFHPHGIVEWTFAEALEKPLEMPRILNIFSRGCSIWLRQPKGQGAASVLLCPSFGGIETFYSM